MKKILATLSTVVLASTVTMSAFAAAPEANVPPKADPTKPMHEKTHKHRDNAEKKAHEHKKGAEHKGHHHDAPKHKPAPKADAKM
ncbi:hypothetical protein I2F27_09280 [Acinetobacter sp. B5B]|uniref:hypothetical protein n=1 Tax=Acinetobacter baretiae TaxID=2605383 RepID=UPI0018C2A144|nr:hypothetical protein [Acinetobacter baretiae]MBF7683512.1 hypothetical protein [Acinetobacter baretiae]MBF7684818.1 hypothetical protein [Acinetobacter baretiae]